MEYHLRVLESTVCIMTVDKLSYFIKNKIDHKINTKGDKHMVLGIVLSIISIMGITYGIIKKKWILAAISILVLIGIIAVWTYFYTHPY